MRILRLRIQSGKSVALFKLGRSSVEARLPTEGIRINHTSIIPTTEHGEFIPIWLLQASLINHHNMAASPLRRLALLDRIDP